MKHLSNEEKAKELATRWKAKGLPYNAIYDTAIEVMQWKDKERKELWRITRNHYQEWAIEQLAAFAVHLNKRGAFREDLCMDFEHEAQSFIESQQNAAHLGI